ncbi:chemokine (C-X-C motif) ligand 12a (stromal cell-derived factor 1) [Xyrauchen texanus]|uniref:chemokine (C-X-C motif) ligand 12a (stromal cell-derived factor 1) n=1 Tax=Xyrauchen texanus TaxID=154827 RepID=UPI00224203BE|nr:chemokine (C-X-C motif) ligand 12a (stromal cell-derived factor 1) [Xyrauchen texanus]
MLSQLLQDTTQCGSLLQTVNMDLKVIVAFALIAVALHATVSDAKPISLVERCWCRSTVNTVPQRRIRELKFLHTPNCPFQVIAKLKNNKEVCINKETKWLQQYLMNALNKMKKA